MMTITCATEEQFYTAIYQLTIKGLGFEADTDRLTIKLTGAY